MSENRYRFAGSAIPAGDFAIPVRTNRFCGKRLRGPQGASDSFSTLPEGLRGSASTKAMRWGTL